MPSELGYWDIRGLAQPIRLLLNYAGEDFVEKQYSVGPAPQFNAECWLKDKFKLGLDFPNLPFYKDEKVNISQSWTILRYLGRKHKLDATTEEDRVRADLAADQLNDFRADFVRICYGPDYEKNKEAYIAALPGKLQQFEQFLGDRPWFVGQNINWIDFAIYEVLSENSIFKPDCLDACPKLKSYVQRFEALPQIKKYRESDKFIERPINNKMANFK